MKIVDNRYKIVNIINSNVYFESYKVIDLWENDKVHFMIMYRYDVHYELIEYFIKKYINHTNIKHENILQSEKFNIVQTIDAKDTNMLLYYLISEYTENPTLEQISNNLNLEEKLEVLIQIILVLDFLHFKGIAYNFLNPSQIFISKENKVKIKSIGAMVEKKFNSRYTEFEKNFVSPEITIGNIKENITVDYYSLGVLIEYLFSKEKTLTKKQKELLEKISKDLIKKNHKKTFNLIEILNQIIDVFELEYTYDLIRFRDNLFFYSETVGREEEVSKVMKIDKDIYNGTNSFKGMLVRGDLGIGKSRFLAETSYRLKMKGRNTYSIKVSEIKDNGLLDISNILKQSFEDTPENLIDKYKDEFSKILPELYLNTKENMLNFSLKTEKYRIYNRISNYFKELSKDRIIYIIIDDIQNSNHDFLQLLNYLLNKTGSSNLFFIFSYEEGVNTEVKKIIEGLLEQSNLIDIKLYNLNLEEIGEAIKNILGTGTLYKDFTSILFRKTQGNPREICSLVKYLYDTGQIYINEKGVWHLTLDNYSEVYIPAKLSKYNLKQLTLAKDKYYELFKTISIFDSFLNENILLGMLKLKPGELEIQLEELIQFKLIVKKLIDKEYCYSIKDIELKKAIYFELTEEEKLSMHKSAAESILALENKNIDHTFEELLYHLIKSKQLNKALDIVLNQIEELDNVYGSRGIYLYTKAYDIAKELNGILKLNILEKLTKIYYVKGNLEEINLYLDEYINASLEFKEYRHLINARLILADTYHVRNQLDLQLEEIKKIEKLGESHNIIDAKIVALSLMSRVNIQEGKFDDAEKLLYKSIELSKNHKTNAYMGELYNRLGVTKFMMGDTIKAIKYYEKSVYFHNKTGNIIDSVMPINNMANIYIDYYCDAEKAMEEYEKGLAITKKYGIKHHEIYFLNNLGSTSLTDYKYDKAFKYIMEANKNAIKLQNLYGVFHSYNNLGKFYLYTGKYDKAYENYKYVNQMIKSRRIVNPETLSSYYDFVMDFYISLGKWNEASLYCHKLKDMHKETNKKDYFKSIYKLLFIRYFKEGYYDKIEMNNLLAKYKDIMCVQDYREILLAFSFISLIEGDMEYTLEMLRIDKELKDSSENDFLNKLRDSIVYYIDSSVEGIDKLIAIEDNFENLNKFPIKLLIKIGIGVKLYSQNMYKESIKYFMESLDTIYKDMLSIPDLDFRFSFVESRQTDSIRNMIRLAVKKIYGESIKFKKLKEINKDQLNDYFETTPIIDIMGYEDFFEIIKLDFYGDVLDVLSIEELISKLTNDYNYNLDLIIKYIAKEVLATKGYILKLEESTQIYSVVSSFNNKENEEINENILKLADKTEEGFFINSDVLNAKNHEYEYKDFLLDNMRGIICVPISMVTEFRTYSMDRRKSYESEKNSIGYIYLETDKVFNRFNREKLETIFKLKYLIHINLENSRLRIDATTDKLTETYTRKYYEKVFEELINNTKKDNGSFSFLMLDIDKFKNVNDRYGHRKGDEVLREIGRILKLSVRSTDIVARYGGEEFTILLKNVGKEEAMVIAEKIRKNIQNIKINGIHIPITISIGISIFPLHSQFKEELIEKADQALYYAKETGRNKVCFWDYSMSDSSNRVDKLAGILTGNIESDNRKILAIVDIIDLIQNKESLKYKVFEFLGRIVNEIEAEFATLILLGKNEPTYYTRVEFSEEFVKTPVLNTSIINRVKENKKGEFLIDWENINDVDSISGIPSWESIIVVPLLKKENLKGIIYLSAPLKTKEFDFNSYNLSKTFANIFSAIL